MAIAGLYSMFDHWHQEGTVWITSDPHFNDPELIAGVAHRPDTETLLRTMNSKIGRTDTWICLGDVYDPEVAKRVRAQYKILILGNHDKGAANYMRKVERRIFDIDKYTKEGALAEMRELFPNYKYKISLEYDSHAPFEFWYVIADNQLFDEVYTGPLMISEKLILSHEPIPNINWAMNVHGHVHNGRIQKDKWHYNVCCDVTGYEPINFNKWMKEGNLANIDSIHRQIIDKATERAKKRGYSLRNKKE